MVDRVNAIAKHVNAAGDDSDDEHENGTLRPSPLHYGPPATVPLSFSAVRWFLTTVTKVFFRRIDVVGSYRIPKTGPVIFVANHNNQFLDPMILYLAIPRIVHFLIAGKSMKRPVHGFFARLCLAIGVDRAQDLVYGGQGTVSAEAEATTVTGQGTAFMKDLSVGCRIKTPETEVNVKAVQSDTSCTIAPSPKSFANRPFKVIPRVDQKMVFGQVNKALKDGEAIGIFPEGGSHDQATMIELKPGVALMSLGAMEYGSGPVQIVPIGLNYFDPYRFRSRVIVEFSPPFEVPTELVPLYKTNKKAAVDQLMAMVQEAMMGTMPGAKNYEELQALITMRALYKPQGRKLTAEESLKVTKKILIARQKLEGDPRMDMVITLTKEYNDILKNIGLRDRDVRLNLTTKTHMAKKSLKSLMELILYSPIAIPTMIMGLPIAIVTMITGISEKKKALAGSSVKVKGLDVVASYKVLVAFIFFPIYNAFLAAGSVLATASKKRYAGAFYLLWPLLFMGGVQVSDGWFKALRSLRSTAVTSTHRDLYKKRQALQLLVRDLIDNLAPSIYPQDLQARVITHEELERDNQKVADMSTRGQQLIPKPAKHGPSKH